jgi:hypothetical protein
MIQLLLGPIIGLIRAIVGLVFDSIVPLGLAAAGVYAADRIGIIDVSAVLTELLPSPTDLIPVLGVML